MTLRALALAFLLGSGASAAELPNLVAVPVNQPGAPHQAPAKEPSFRHAFFRCADGTAITAGGQTSCKSADVWRSEADAVCRGHCKVIVLRNERVKRCGLLSFYVKTECP